ncbi:MAG: DUF4382 domain-containing protein [Pseudomonadota bacterium]
MSQLNHATTEHQGTRSLRNKLSVLTLLLWSVMLVGCGGGGGGGDSVPAPISTAPPDEGELFVGLTDAEGDFLSYAVAVSALSLERVNGDTVQALPLATVVDFTELTEVTEFLTVATVPAGTYAAASLRLDYTDATIVVQDDAGNAVEAIAVDANGEPVTTLDVRLSLASTEQIRITPGRPASFSLDFDLDASNEIDLTTAPARVTVEPFLLASAELEQDREHRVRGVLAGVDPAAEAITLKVRPFRHRQGNFGELTFAVDNETAYEIDGELFTGAAGLDVMAGLNENTPVVAGLSVGDDGRVANTLLAGTSVPWASQDVAKGTITARDGNTITVRGATVSFNDGVHAYRDTITVTVGDETTVTAFGPNGDGKTATSLSVGQRVTVFGTLTDANRLDATAGSVRMLQNQLIAEILQPNPLVVDLHFLNGRRPDVFDFTGTGVDVINDADPAAYEIGTTVLDLAALNPGALLRVRGLVNDFGLAPPDFNATTLVDINTDARSASFKARWQPAAARPFQSLDPATVALDLEAARTLLRLRGVPVELTNPVTALMLLAPPEDSGVYAVKVRGDGGELRLFRTFSGLVNELTAQLDTGAALAQLSVHGQYDADAEALVARRASFTFLSPAQ